MARILRYISARKAALKNNEKCQHNGLLKKIISAGIKTGVKMPDSINSFETIFEDSAPPFPRDLAANASTEPFTQPRTANIIKA